MFLSLVRPDRISSPMTSTAAVTSGAGDSVMMILDPGSPRAPSCGPQRPYPAIVRYHAPSHPQIVPEPLPPQPSPPLSSGPAPAPSAHPQRKTHRDRPLYLDHAQ